MKRLCDNSLQCVKRNLHHYLRKWGPHASSMSPKHNHIHTPQEKLHNHIRIWCRTSCCICHIQSHPTLPTMSLSTSPNVLQKLANGWAKSQWINLFLFIEKNHWFEHVNELLQWTPSPDSRRSRLNPHQTLDSTLVLKVIKHHCLNHVRISCVLMMSTYSHEDIRYVGIIWFVLHGPTLTN